VGARAVRGAQRVEGRADDGARRLLVVEDGDGCEADGGGEEGEGAGPAEGMVGVWTRQGGLLVGDVV
jgi:hypothetical protein